MEAIIIGHRAKDIKAIRTGMARLGASKGDEAATKEVEAKDTTAAEASNSRTSSRNSSPKTTSNSGQEKKQRRALPMLHVASWKQWKTSWSSTRDHSGMMANRDINH